MVRICAPRLTTEKEMFSAGTLAPCTTSGLRFLHGLCRTMSCNQFQNAVSISALALVQPQRVKENAPRPWSVAGSRSGRCVDEAGWKDAGWGATLGFPRLRGPAARVQLLRVLRIHHPLLPFRPLPLPLPSLPPRPAFGARKRPKCHKRPRPAQFQTRGQHVFSEQECKKH